MGFVQWIQNQAVAYTVYSLALVAMAVLLAVIVANLFILGTKGDKLEYLKNYKKGQFVIIYFIAIPLYFFGSLHAAANIGDGTDVLNCFLDSIKASFDLVKLDFGMGDISDSMRADNFYCATMIVCYVVTVINVLLFSSSLLWQRLKNFCKKVRARFSKNLYIVVGDNKNNIRLLNSLKAGNKKARGLMLAKPDAATRDKLYLNGICYSAFDSAHGSGEHFYKKLKPLLGFEFKSKIYTNKNVTVIINTEDDERNLLYGKELEKLLNTTVKSREISAGIKAQFKVRRGEIENSDTDKEQKEKDLKECKLKEKQALKKDKQFLSVPVNSKNALITAYIFSKVENQSAFKEQVENSCGHIKVLDKYEQIAIDFVNEYPLTKFMTDKQINYGKGLIENDAEINVCFVGFGDTNRQIFLKTISDSQFFTEVNGKIVHKKVHYYVYDKDAAHNDKNLNQTYFRYSLEFYKEYEEYKKKMLKAGVQEGSEKWDYLPLPDYPADDWYNPELNKDLSHEDNHFKKHFVKTDINSYDFYNGLKEVICGDKAYTYIIVAFGKDIENVDLAKKISARLEMWGKSENAHIFVKVRSNALADGIKSEDGIIKFGSTESVYDFNKIVSNPLQEMAYLKSFKYSRGIKSDAEKHRREAIEKWMGLSSEQKTSNFYCCLNLRTKLNLLGFDYAEADTQKDNASDKFLEKYFGTKDSGEIEKQCKEFEASGEGNYTYDKGKFKDGSVRTLLAMQEHQRWNSNYICSGIVPPQKHEIDGKGGGKDMVKRLVHYNLTTFEGLEEYRVKAAGSASEEHKYKKEVRPYDYRIMDYADRLLEDAGFKIIELNVQSEEKD